MRRILIAEDEEDIREFVVINMKRAGYDVVDVPDGETALRVFEENGGDFDVVLLDIMMPGIDGFGVCEKIRAQSPSIGIIMLSAKSQEMDKVRGLMTGADDYITKPFSPSELTARVDAIHRRVTMAKGIVQPTDEVVSGPFTLNTKSRTLKKNGQLLDLTQVEFQIIEFFIKNPNAAMDRAAILKQVWGENYFGDVKIVDVNIRRLRMKIEDEPSSPQYLQTVWGFGYKWIV
ncbi:MAG: response regulator transcription factor [Oscillospiraceae bacterium]|nr:response regulator transcription factor [Oscillospiraceae bacterium]